MKERLHYIDLYDLYGTLLTEKQQHCFEDYYFNNLTLSEISENNEVSRSAIQKTLKELETKLELYETKLSLLKKIIKIEKILDKTEYKDKVIDTIKE